MNYHEGFWNGEKAQFRVVVIVVGDEPNELIAFLGQSRPNLKRYLWFVPFVGQQRQAVEVVYNGTSFFLDNSDGSGVRKVTLGFGSPGWGHRSVYPKEVLHEVPKESWQEWSLAVRDIVEAEIREGWLAIDRDGYLEHLKDMESLKQSFNKIWRR